MFKFLIVAALLIWFVVPALVRDAAQRELSVIEHRQYCADAFSTLISISESPKLSPLHERWLSKTAQRCRSQWYGETK